MYKQIKLEDATGKVIKKSHYEESTWKEHLFLFFDDDTYVIISGVPNNEYGELEHDEELNVSEFPAKMLIEMGLTTQEEIDEKDRKAREEQNASTERRERVQLSNLLRKYPDAQS